jgi:hypothetical protein
MAMITHILAVDGGGTKTRAALASADGTQLAEHTGGPCNLFQDPESGLAEIRALWRHLAANAGLDLKPMPPRPASAPASPGPMPRAASPASARPSPTSQPSTSPPTATRHSSAPPPASPAAS